jgi:hypothetical protein
MEVVNQGLEMEREYIKAVLAWLDVLLERQVAHWQLSGQNPTDRFRGLYVTDAEALKLIQRGVGSHWGSGAALTAEDEQRLKEAEQVAEERIKTIEKEAETKDILLRLRVLADIFGLDDFDWWAFIICLAPALDLRYERIYGYLQDDVTRLQASVDLIFNLLLSEGIDRLDYLNHFSSAAPLRKFRLLIPESEEGHKSLNVLRQSFSVDPAVISWLLGNYAPAGDQVALYLFNEASPEEQEDAASVFELDKMPGQEVLLSIRPILSFYGEDMLQQELAVRRLAIALKRPLLKLKLSAEDSIEDNLEKIYPLVRDARLLNALLYLQGCDSLIDRDGCLLLQAYKAFSLFGDCIVCSTKRSFKFAEDMQGNDYPLMRVPFSLLTAGERADLWSALLEGAADAVARKELDVLAGQFTLTSGQVVAAASAALSQALQDGRQLQTPDLFEAARIYSDHHLVELAQKITPRYHWEDLVLPETPISMLQELVSMVKSRTRVLEEWGLGRKLTASAGVSALFTGQSGTGKTLAAQIIANELGIDLYRIDLSTVVSKYIGETEKNLECIFNEAQTSNAILFFDEADSIFGKRSEVKDAHDRYANIEVGYLLQRMEAYDGIAILATNLRANLDEAFTRRLQFIIAFPFPDEEYRRKIWEVLIPPSLPRKDDINLDLMAKRFKLAGGNIRNIIVSAAYLAASNGNCMTMQHLMHGARREFQKMGRLINETDFVV